MKRIIALATAASLAFAGAAAADHHKQDKMDKQEKKDIVATAQSVDSLSTLVAAVQAADLVETLQGEGPFTVFAPTNDAFAAIQDTVDTLLMPENKEQLQGVLTYHVVSGKYSAEDAMEAAADGPIELETVAGGTLTVEVSDGDVMITDANGGTATVAKADVMTSNGVVHVIDAVLVPSM